MNLSTTLQIPISVATKPQYWRSLFAGILLPLGFAPFHFPGLTILGLALFYALLQKKAALEAFWIGFVFGLGFLGFGVSWVYVSIHEYGHLNELFSAGITFIFIAYLALFPATLAFIYSKLNRYHALTFAALWTLFEYVRSFLFTGFPWMLLGFAEIDTPLKHLLPLVGVYGVGFFAALSATCLVSAIIEKNLLRYAWLTAFVAILLLPLSLKNISWTKLEKDPISVGVIQANLSMRDKWDESLFWDIVDKYQQTCEKLLGKKKLIILPESAIPLPASYVNDLLDELHSLAIKKQSAVLFGIPEATDVNETDYFNTIATLGTAEGRYVKQHLVPFGEYTPRPFSLLMKWFIAPMSNLKPGKSNQPLMLVDNHPIASLICYELAFPHLLRRQLPMAQWIVSISDDGWFGHSLAMHQHLQIAQVLSKQTGRYQVVSNNDGLSSIIDDEGNIKASLGAFTDGVLESELYPATSVTPWFYFGDLPILLSAVLILIFGRKTKTP